MGTTRWLWRRAGRRLTVAVLAAAGVVLGAAAEAAGVVAPEPSGGSGAVSRAASAPTGWPSAVGSGSGVRFPAVAGSPSAGAPASGWGWPLDPRPTVLATFDPPDVTWGAGHRGVDLAASVDQAVLAPTAGVVAFSGVVVDRGVLVITTATGLRTSVEPVDAGPPVGTVVARGDPVGRVAATPGHCAPATCLHWGVRRDDTYLDPLALVGARRVVLLPLTPP